MYFRNDLQCGPIEDPVSKVKNSFWGRLSLKGDDISLVAVIYPPPSSTSEMDFYLAFVLRRGINTTYIHILSTGDFNVQAQAAPREQFMAGLQEYVSSFPLDGQIYNPTRSREKHKPSILYRIFTKEKPMVEWVIADVPMGRSDHVVLLFEYICFAECPVAIANATKTIIRYELLARLGETANWNFLIDHAPASA